MHWDSEVRIDHLHRRFFLNFLVLGGYRSTIISGMRQCATIPHRMGSLFFWRCYTKHR